MKRLISTIVFSLLLVGMGLLSSCRDQNKETDSREELENAPPTAPSGNTETDKTDDTSLKEDSDLEVNPAHGQPGHRCDIPVGAPLNQTTTQEASRENSQSPVRLRKAAPKINPPHGEPGHDCSVPIGAELGR